MKRFITIDTNGVIINTVATNDPDFSAVEGASLLEIEDASQWHKIKEKPRHFHVQDGELKEKSQEEKAAEDEKIRPQKKFSLESRINDLEKIILAMQADIDKLKKKTP